MIFLNHYVEGHQLVTLWGSDPPLCCIWGEGWRSRAVVFQQQEVGVFCLQCRCAQLQMLRWDSDLMGRSSRSPVFLPFLFFSLMERFHSWLFQESNFLLRVFNFCEGIVILAAPLLFSVLGADRYSCQKGGRKQTNKQKKNGVSCYEDVTRIKRNAIHQKVFASGQDLHF